MPYQLLSLSISVLCHINFSHYQPLFYAISTSFIINLCSMPYQLLSLSTSVLCHINFSHYQPLFYAISTSLIINLLLCHINFSHSTPSLTLSNFVTLSLRFTIWFCSVTNGPQHKLVPFIWQGIQRFMSPSQLTKDTDLQTYRQPRMCGKHITVNNQPS